jgi:hypothetical protein
MMGEIRKRVMDTPAELLARILDAVVCIEVTLKINSD